MEIDDEFKKEDGSIDWGKYYSENLNKKGKRDNSKSNLDLNKMSVFKKADDLSDKIWDIVSKWNWFEKKTIGDQLVRAVDSIGANIAEGYGRYSFKEYIMFLYYARGSLYESRFWLKKAKKRSLIKKSEYLKIKKRIDKLPKELNKVIKIVKSKEKEWKKK